VTDHSTRTLGVWSDGTDTVIAYDKFDVIGVIREHAGSFESVDEFVRRDDDYVLVINHVDMPDGSDGKIALTCREWIAKYGRSFLCSTEY
jgi:hypothetical protein